MATYEYDTSQSTEIWNYVSPQGSNLLVMVFVVVSLCWGWRLVRHIVKISEIAIGIHTNQLMYLDGVNLPNDDLDLLSRNHLRQLISATRSSPSVPVPQIRPAVMLNKQSLGLIESADKSKIGVKFTFDSSAPCVVDSYWNIKAELFSGMKESGYANLSEDCVGMRHRREDEESGKSLPKKKLGFFSGLVGGSGNSASLNDNDIEMHDMENGAASSTEVNVASFFDIGQEGIRGESVCYGAGESHVYVSTEEHMIQRTIPAFLDRKNGVEGGVYPLVLVFRSFRQKGKERVATSSCVVAVVDFTLRTAPPSPTPEGNTDAEPLLPVPAVWRKYIFTEKSCLEVQDIYGLQDSTSPECVVCLTDDKDVMLMPCRHLCVCHGCFKRIDKCPVCRSAFDAYSLVIRDEEKKNG